MSSVPFQTSGTRMRYGAPCSSPERSSGAALDFVAGERSSRVRESNTQSVRATKILAVTFMSTSSCFWEWTGGLETITARPCGQGLGGHRQIFVGAALCGRPSQETQCGKPGAATEGRPYNCGPRAQKTLLRFRGVDPGVEDVGLGQLFILGYQDGQPLFLAAVLALEETDGA